jgi:salicylate hydroxylase
MQLGKSAEQRYGAPYLTLHRADLHAALREAAQSLASVALSPGFDVASVEVQTNSVVARAHNGSEAEGSSLIGADGLWSTIRSLIAPQARLAFTGGTAWRTILPRKDLPPPFDAPIVGLWLGPRSHLVHYPVRGGDELNVVAVTEGGTERQGWNEPASHETLRAGFTRWCNESKSLLDRASSWRSWSLYRLRGVSRFGQGPVALIGDAAHPVLPYLAQGAALAIEDAVTLASCLKSVRADPVAAFAHYETLRHPRVTRVQRLSERFGRLYHLRGPLRLARNAVLARRREERALQGFDWLYGYEDQQR